MNRTTSARYIQVRTAAYDNLVELLKNATEADYALAQAWYGEAGEFAASLCEYTSWNMEVSCSVVSAFSPRVTWAHNKVKAQQYAQGIMPLGLSSHIVAADRCLKEGFKGLRGLKTHNFARAIAGDTSAIVIDVWMARGAKLTHGVKSKYAGQFKNSPSVTEYRAISGAIESMAKGFNMEPSTLQALLWILIRGKAD